MPRFLKYNSSKAWL